MIQGLYNGAVRRVTFFGGNANNSANAGAFYWNLNNDSGNANQNIGSRLTCYKIIKYLTRYMTLPLGKTLCSVHRVESLKVLVALCRKLWDAKTGKQINIRK